LCVRHTDIFLQPSYSGDRNRRIMVWDQLRQKLARPCLKYKPGMVAHACGPSYLGVWGRRIVIWGKPRQLAGDLSEKQTKSKKTGGMTKVIEHLLPKCMALSSIPSTITKKSLIFLNTRIYQFLRKYLDNYKTANISSFIARLKSCIYCFWVFGFLPNSSKQIQSLFLNIDDSDD
jgi:hypothetical protein